MLGIWLDNLGKDFLWLGNIDEVSKGELLVWWVRNNVRTIFLQRSSAIDIIGKEMYDELWDYLQWYANVVLEDPNIKLLNWLELESAVLNRIYVTLKELIERNATENSRESWVNDKMSLDIIWKERILLEKINTRIKQNMQIENEIFWGFS